MKRLQDIADQVGVSRTTVSNVLHGNTKKVSKEMIRKISEILNQEGYVPNISSRELTRKGSCIIGLVLGYNCVHGIPSLRDTFVAELLSGVEETAHRNGYYVMLINGHDQNTDRMAEIASRWNVDGLVVLGLDEKKYKELRRQLNKYMVLIDTYPEAEYHYVNVGTDDFGGGAMIAKYLLDNGYTQAIFVAECDTGADHYRWKGFQHQMRSAGIDCGEERHILLPEDLSLRRVMYGHYLDCFVQAGAVALASDYDAAEVMNYLQDHGIQVPEQVSVTGFDDCIYAELMHPPLTTVRQNVPAKAEAAVELLVRLIRQEPVECKNYVQPVELIRRNSVRESTPNAAAEEKDPDSVLNYYKQMITLRKSHLGLIYGSFQLLAEENPQVFAYRRTLAETGENYLIACNFSDKDAAFTIPADFAGARRLIGNYPDTAPTGAVTLRPYEAFVLQK